ncbi:DUF1573 domain-containing protein [Patescibacteria group bacterium]|nr:DUF1573 domain-containing protein [Patescibacteria group bacterium]
MNTEDNKKEVMGEDCPLCKVSEDTIKNLENAGSNKEKKYFLKREIKEQERLVQDHKKKRNKIIKFSVVGLVAILIIGGAGLKIAKSFQGKNFGPAKVEITEMSYDAGTVSMADGLVKHTYEIKNTGEGDLKLKNIRTSCMCTTVYLKIGDKLSPKFGMHDNPPIWTETIPPGETGYLEVTFDPAFHGPEGIGSLVRAVYVSTNDPDNKDLEFLLSIDVTK